MSKKLIAFCLSLVSLLLFASCGKFSTAANAVGNDAPQNSVENADPKNAGKTADAKIGSSSNAETFLGGIGDSRVQISLTRDGDNLSGNYFYRKIGTELKLVGTIDKQGNFTLQETDQAGSKTGEWKGKWEEINDNATISGKWKNQKGASETDFYADEIKTEFSGGAKITTKATNEADKSKNSKIADEYPELSGVEAAAKFNELVKNYVAGVNKDYKAVIAGLTAEEVKQFAEYGLSEQLTYNVVTANDNLISVLFTDSSFTGGAHGSSTTKTINYDLKNNRELKLADLFEPNADYLQTLSKLSLADLKAQKIEATDEEMLNEGTTATEENFRSWNLSKKGLQLNFDAYQVASYAAGPQTVIIPYAKLDKILRKDSAGRRIDEIKPERLSQK